MADLKRGDSVRLKGTDMGTCPLMVVKETNLSYEGDRGYVNCTWYSFDKSSFQESIFHSEMLEIQN